jgi:hypothetical protein
MRLLNAKSGRLEEFMTDRPSYVILSHTWADGEVSFQDIHKPDVADLPGYRKISKCCEQALRSGFEWVWVDTCCINKESSSELTEAINSMYEWYWQAEICYAYLVDVSAEDDRAAFHSNFENSNWFNRGWTLQELLAPAVVEFYDRDWTFIGTKCSLVSSLEKATTIETKHLINRESIVNATIGTRFSWASMRKTTRPEDMSYCLLGLFSVNMPLLYGEGTRAFYRLQLEIIKWSSDHTIFAWNPRPGDTYEIMGIFAPSPRQFKDTARIKCANMPRAVPVESMYSTYNITNRGLRISLPRLDTPDKAYIGLLNCRYDRQSYIGIRLKQNPQEDVSYGNVRLVRAKNSKLETLTRSEVSHNYPYSVFIQAESCLVSQTLHESAKKTKVEVVRVDSPSWKVHHIAVLPRKESDLRWLLPEERISDNTFVVTGSMMYISVLVERVTSAVVIGHKEHQIMVGMVSPAPGKSLSEYDDTIKRLQETGGLNIDRDYNAWPLTPDLELIVSARKTGTKDSVLWTVSIKVSYKITERGGSRSLAPNIHGYAPS